VTSSVHVAGVLLVFSFLVIPPVIALLFTQKKGFRLAVGWLVAFGGSVLGIAISVSLNLPAGPSIVGSLVLILVLSVLIRQLVLIFKRF